MTQNNERVDITPLKQISAVQSIREAKTLEDAMRVMNGLGANGWLSLWDSATHPDGTSCRDKSPISHNEQQEAVAEIVCDPMFLPALKVPLVVWKADIVKFRIGTELYTSPHKQIPDGWISLKDALDRKVLKWGWYVDGENCNEPVYKLNAYGHSAKTYKAHDNQLWSAIVDGSGYRGLLNEAEAKSYVEDVIKSKLYEQAKSADKLRSLIELNASPTNTEVGE